MTLQVDFSFIEKFVKKYPMLDYSKCHWVFTQDFYFTNDKNKKKPFDKGKEIFQRTEAFLNMPQDEKIDLKTFCKTAENFFKNPPTEWENTTHYWLYGKLNDLELTNCDNAEVITNILEVAGFFNYFKSEKLTVVLPSFGGSVFLVYCGNKLFFYFTDEEFLKESLFEDLKLNEYKEIKKTWAEICFEEKNNV